jgi:hypothetical protein
MILFWPEFTSAFRMLDHFNKDKQICSNRETIYPTTKKFYEINPSCLHKGVNLFSLLEC